MKGSSPVGSPKGSEELFRLSLGLLESRKKEEDATASRSTLKAFPTKREERAVNTEWPALSVSSPKGTNETALSSNQIQLGQKPREISSAAIRPDSWKVYRKTPEDYERNRIGKYAPYFQGNVILLIPEVANVLQPLIALPVVFDIKKGDL